MDGYAICGMFMLILGVGFFVYLIYGSIKVNKKNKIILESALKKGVTGIKKMTPEEKREYLKYSRSLYDRGILSFTQFDLISSKCNNQISLAEMGISDNSYSDKYSKQERKNETKTIVKDAVIGGVVAGPAGAVVGAIVGKNKVDKKQNNE